MAKRGAAKAVAMAKSQLLSDQSLMESEFGKMPDNIMVEIFEYLDPRDRCRIARVCKAWNRLINDKLLWRHVDLQKYRVDLRSVWKVIRNHFSSTLTSLKLKGFLHSVRKTECLSNSVLLDLKERCPKLEHLEITEANFSSLQVASLPSSLTTLVLKFCEIPTRWFKDLKTNNEILPSLQYIDLSACTRISNLDVDDLMSRKSIRVLKLNDCYRVKDSAVQNLTAQLHNLEILGLAGCDITDLSLHHISRHLKKLKFLNLSECVSLTDTGVGNLCMMTTLRWLSLYQCHSLSDNAVGQMSKCLKSLKYFNISGMKISDESRDEIQAALPGCDVVSDGSRRPLCNQLTC
ncbi:F-box/LRR-repeat protein 12-like [Glandiceps talaboti]